MGWPSIDGVLNQYLPSIRRLLQCVQVKCDQIVEKVTLHLTTEDVDLAAKYVQSMSVAARRSWSSWECARPLLRCCCPSVPISSSTDERHPHVFSKYKVSSSTSPSSIFVSPPNTMKALPTSKLACPTRGPGPSLVVATGKQVMFPGPASTIHRSPFTVLPLISPPIK